MLRDSQVGEQLPYNVVRQLISMVVPRLKIILSNTQVFIPPSVKSAFFISVNGDSTFQVLRSKSRIKSYSQSFSKHQCNHASPTTIISTLTWIISKTPSSPDFVLSYLCLSNCVFNLVTGVILLNIG